MHETGHDHWLKWWLKAENEGDEECVCSLNQQCKTVIVWVTGLAEIQSLRMGNLDTEILVQNIIQGNRLFAAAEKIKLAGTLKLFVRISI